MDYVIFVHNENNGRAFLRQLNGKTPLFARVIGVTETAKTSGMPAAGKYPELTDYTSPTDIEFLLLGKCKCISGVPVTPEGIPTHALIIMSALGLVSVPALVVNSGLAKP